MQPGRGPRGPLGRVTGSSRAGTTGRATGHSRLRSIGQVTGLSRIVGTRTAWTGVGDGEFFCPGCGGDRNYQRLLGRRRFTLLGVPVLPRGETGPVVECAACRRHHATDVLDHPTTTRFSAMLRDAVHTVALAVLAADGSCSRTSLTAAATAARAAGFDDCTEDQLAALVEALAADTGRLYGRPCGAGLAIELHEALDPLSPHLAPAGREAILLQGARIALADGSYTPAEREVLSTVGAALMICADDVTRLLAEARTPS
ncbi:TerB family tellurite resistance protein [Streptomyces sp. NPDC002643]